MNDQKEIKYPTMMMIPSLSVDGEFISVIGIRKDEAIAYSEAFTTLVAENRRLKDSTPSIPVTDPDDGALALFSGNLNLKSLIVDGGSGKLGDLATKLSVSEIPGARGRRVIFIDVENDTIGVGTTVVYNHNWAMLGVRDDSIMASVLETITEEE